jgi:uncharacterized protein YbcV (DUF1398 family)
MQPIGDLKTLLTHMQPELNPGRYAFAILPPNLVLNPIHIVASVREPEGLSVVLPEHIAQDLGLPVAFIAAWITLTVHSDLAAVGLTAAFSQALGQARISCNVVAGVYHDHLFVPVEQAQQAMDALHSLSRSTTSQFIQAKAASRRSLTQALGITTNFLARTDMDADAVISLAKTTLEGSLPFPQIVGELIAQGVEYYHVDYASKSFTFYSAGGAAIFASLTFEGLPSISQEWNESALKEAILDSQQNGQTFRQFCARAMSAGVQGYFAFLRGQRVTYLGRNGDQHVEWLPGAKLSDA